MPDLTTDLPPEERGNETPLEKKLRRIAELQLLGELEKNYRDVELQKVAKMVFAKWNVLYHMMDWEELHLEGCADLTLTEYEMGIKGEREKGKPLIRDRGAFYRTICQRICYKKAQGEYPNQPIDPIELLLPNLEGDKTDKRAILINMLHQFGLPCGLLLFLFYMGEPPVKDKETLYQVAIFLGANVKSPKGMDNGMWECRRRFRDFVSQHPNFEDLFN